MDSTNLGGPPARFSNVLVLFDWNGTLVLDADRARAALNVVLHARRLPLLSPGAFTARFHLPMSAMFTALGIRQSDAAGAEAEWNAAMAGLAAMARPGLTDAVRQLHSGGAYLGVVSASNANAIDADFRHLGIRHRFDSIDTDAADKPRVLRERRDRRGPGSRAYYVGDTTYDIRSALAAGYIPIGVRDGYTRVPALLDAGAAAIVDDLREVVDIVASDTVQT